MDTQKSLVVKINWEETFNHGNLVSVWFAVRESVVNMLTVGARVRESFEAFWTLERFFSGVKSSVLGQVMLVLESLVTVAAFMRSLI